MRSATRDCRRHLCKTRMVSVLRRSNMSDERFKKRLWHGLKVGVVLALYVLASSCATEEETQFGDPARVSGGFGSSSSGAPTCTVDPDCEVSFRDTVFAQILVPAGGCGATGCHEASIGGFQFDEFDAQAAYNSLREFQHPIFGGYVVPCSPETSGLLCNLAIEPGATTPHPAGNCGSKMPKYKDPDSPVDSPLNQQQLNTIAEWISCGAPFN